MEAVLVDHNQNLLDDIHDAVSALEHLDFDMLGADDRAEALRDLDRQRTRIEARFSRELRGLAPVEHLKPLGVASVSGWLVAATGTTRRDAGRRTTLANTLAELPLVEAAMLEGVIPIEAARIIARYANRAQRRALAAPDRGCAFPGCDRSHHYCDAHHIIWWERDGRTDLDNLVLICRFHHVLVHAGLYQADIEDHRPVFRPTDPGRPGWTGRAMDPDWHRHPPDKRRRPDNG